MSRNACGYSKYQMPPIDNKCLKNYERMEQDFEQNCFDPVPRHPCVAPDLTIEVNPEYAVRYVPQRYANDTKRERQTAVLEKGCYQESLIVETDFICHEIPGPQWTSRFCLQRINVLLSRPELEHMVQRTVSIWSIYLKKSPEGLFLQDVDIAANILSTLGKKYEAMLHAPDLLDLMISHLNKGIRVDNICDDGEVKRLAYTFTILGQTAVDCCPEVQLKLLRLIITWMDLVATSDTPNASCQSSTMKTPKSCKPSKMKTPICCNKNKEKGVKNVFSTKPLIEDVMMKALELSKLPRLLGDLVKDVGFSKAYCLVLLLLRRCVDVSEIIRLRVLKMPLLDPLLLKLCIDDESNKILARTVELIYSYLGPSGDDSGIKTPVPHEGTFQILLTRFFKQLTQFSSKLELNLRNDSAFLICFLAKNIPPLKKRFGRYAQAISTLVTSNLRGGPCIQIPYTLDSTPEDAELLHYLIQMLELILSSGNSLNIIDEFGLVPALVDMLIGPSRLMSALSDVTNTENIETAVWSTLMAIAQSTPEAFLTSSGFISIIDFLQIYTDSGMTSPRFVSMFCFLTRTILTSDSMTESLMQEQIIPLVKNKELLQTLINCILRLTVKNFDISDEPTLANLLLCCAAIGQNDVNEKESFANYKGVKVLTRLIRQLLYHPAHERHMDPVLHIAIAECTLRCVADSPSCLEIFLGYEGLLRMLDLLEISAGPPASLHILNCILELCEYPRCMDQIVFWRRRRKDLTQRMAYTEGFKVPDNRVSTKAQPTFGEVMGDLILDYDHTLGALLCDLWRDEELRWGVLRDSEGCISSIAKPLMSEYGRNSRESWDKRIRNPSEYPGPSCVDMMGSIRPKIFLLVKKITDAVNTEAQLFDGLGLKNQLTMQIVINFLDLKRGEILMELMDELQEECFKMVPSDRKLMEVLVDVSKNKVAAIVETQRYLIRRDLERDEIQERQLYNAMQMCHLQDHLKAVREAEYNARTTHYNYLVERRLWQKTQLQNAVVKSSNNTRIYRTTDGPLNITVWPQKTKFIQADLPLEEMDGEFTEFAPMYQRGSKLQSMTIVSPYDDGSRMGSMADITDLNSRRWSPEARSHNMSYMTGVEGATPKSAEGGFYVVPAVVLTKALQLVLAKEKKKGWLANIDDENYWRVRAKWKQDWYPDVEMTRNNFGQVIPFR